MVNGKRPKALDKTLTGFTQSKKLIEVTSVFAVRICNTGAVSGGLDIDGDETSSLLFFDMFSFLTVRRELCFNKCDRMLIDYENGPSFLDYVAMKSIV